MREAKEEFLDRSFNQDNYTVEDSQILLQELFHCLMEGGLEEQKQLKNKWHAYQVMIEQMLDEYFVTEMQNKYEIYQLCSKKHFLQMIGELYEHHYMKHGELAKALQIRDNNLNRLIREIEECPVRVINKGKNSKYTIYSLTPIGKEFAYEQHWKQEDVEEKKLKFRYPFIEKKKNSHIEKRKLAHFDTKNVKYMACVFQDCQYLSELHSISDWDTSNVTDMQAMFNGCQSLYDASAINDWDVTNVKTGSDYNNGFYLMFGSCSPHPEFTKRAGTWDSEGTFHPTT